MRSGYQVCCLINVLTMVLTAWKVHFPAADYVCIMYIWLMGALSTDLQTLAKPLVNEDACGIIDSIVIFSLRYRYVLYSLYLGQVNSCTLSVCLFMSLVEYHG